jgi:5'-methylthioadenosine phosphorylase
VYRQLRFDVIGMTNLTEAKLAREAEIPYATLAMITDYDCWHPEHDSVTVAQIIGNLTRNTENAQKVLREALRGLSADLPSVAFRALETAIITDRKKIPAAAKKRLAAVIGKYIS